MRDFCRNDVTMDSAQQSAGFANGYPAVLRMLMRTTIAAGRIMGSLVFTAGSSADRCCHRSRDMFLFG